MFFDDIRDIFVSKHKDKDLHDYSPFMVSRGLSFISPEVLPLVNEINSIQELVENKEMHYNVCVKAFPKMARAPRIDYIKKAPKDKNVVSVNSFDFYTKKDLERLQVFQDDQTSL
jgi:hypothetical protein